MVPFETNILFRSFGGYQKPKKEHKKIHRIRLQKCISFTLDNRKTKQKNPVSLPIYSFNSGKMIQKPSFK